MSTDLAKFELKQLLGISLIVLSNKSIDANDVELEKVIEPD